jgi:hypothetical protein
VNHNFSAPFTCGTQIRHFVMVITSENANLLGTRRLGLVSGSRAREPHPISVPAVSHRN